MDIHRKIIPTNGIKLFLVYDGQEIARAYLYVMKNDLHDQPFGLLEDLYVDESFRGQGNGEKLVREVVEKARRQGCYKLICTSRHGREELHRWYKELGFTDHGKEFRRDF